MHALTAEMVALSRFAVPDNHCFNEDADHTSIQQYGQAVNRHTVLQHVSAHNLPILLYACVLSICINAAAV